jgi:RNA polymerase sigma-70 factor (family 1)
LDLFNEYELVARLRNGDVQAFDSLYRKYHKALFANINKLVRNPAASEDILQEVFIALWEKSPTLKTDDHIAGWLFVVSYNKTVNYLKKELRESVSCLPEETELAAAEPDIDLSGIQSRLLEEAIAQLSPQKRKVFELCKIYGKSYEETASELHISKHTVKEYLVLAVHYIRNYVRQHPEYRSSLLQTGFIAMWLCV